MQNSVNPPSNSFHRYKSPKRIIPALVIERMSTVYTYISATWLLSARNITFISKLANSPAQAQKLSTDQFNMLSTKRVEETDHKDAYTPCSRFTKKVNRGLQLCLFRSICQAAKLHRITPRVEDDSYCGRQETNGGKVC